MNPRGRERLTAPPPPGSFFISPAHLFFFLSGFAALVYETVWTRRLVLVFGATLSSASAVLAAFMTGMALGAVWGARLSRSRDPLRVYGKLELGIAACAAAFPFVVRAILLYIEETALPAAPVRFALIFAALLPATTLMGATFPVLVRHARGDGDAGRSVGGLYAANLLGSCLGTLSTAYVLLAFLGLSGSHWLAVLINAAVGLAALALGARAPHRREPSASPAPSRAPADAHAVASLFVAGVCGMAFEIVWLRILTPSFNNSAYGFASVVFVFLLGLGGGSLLAARSKAVSPAALGGLQLLAGLYAFVGYRLFEITQLVQIRLGTMGDSGISPVVFAPLAEAVVLLLPLAVLQGALLPIAARLTAREGGASEAAARLYFWNTVGGIVGATAAGFWLVPALGVQNALFAVVAASAAAGAALVARHAARVETRIAAPVLAAALVALTLASGATPLPRKVLLDWLNRGSQEFVLRFYADDSEASVAVPSPMPRLIINGVGVTGYTNATKILAHLPLLLHPKPERVLIICFGMGGTFRSALSHPVGVEVVDIVPSVFETFKLFHKDAAARLADPRARLFVNDGRNHLLRSKGGYDAILVDPSPPLYAAGTVNLYSRDFYELARRKLRPGGLLAVWLPEYPEPDYKMILKSFTAAMPHAQFWLGTKQKGGLIMLGSDSPIPDDRARVARRLREAGVRADLLELDDEFKDDRAFWSLYLGPAEKYAAYLAGSPEVTDDFPRLEYPYFRSKTREYYNHPAILTGR